MYPIFYSIIESAGLLELALLIMLATATAKTLCALKQTSDWTEPFLLHDDCETLRDTDNEHDKDDEIDIGDDNETDTDEYNQTKGETNTDRDSNSNGEHDEIDFGDDNETDSDEDSFLPNGCPVDYHVHWLLPHEYNCYEYYYCLRGEKVLRSCGQTLHFNPAIQVSLALIFYILGIYRIKLPIDLCFEPT